MARGIIRPSGYGTGFEEGYSYAFQYIGESKKTGGTTTFTVPAGKSVDDFIIVVNPGTYTTANASHDNEGGGAEGAHASFTLSKKYEGNTLTVYSGIMVKISSNTELSGAQQYKYPSYTVWYHPSNSDPDE